MGKSQGYVDGTSTINLNWPDDGDDDSDDKGKSKGKPPGKDDGNEKGNGKGKKGRYKGNDDPLPPRYDPTQPEGNVFTGFECELPDLPSHLEWQPWEV